MPFRSLVALSIVLVFAASPGFASTPVNAGYRDFSYGSSGNSTPTGEKPQSYLWWNDGLWWGMLWDSHESAFVIHRFDVESQSWSSTGTEIDNRGSAKGDVLWDGEHLYAVTYIFSTSAGPASNNNSGRLYRFTYHPGTKTYTKDGGFPVKVNSSKSETLVIDKDSTGQLWVTWVESGKVKVNRSTGSDLTWGTPFDLPTQGSSASSDDISSLVAMDGKIGLMWSNQSSRGMYFSVHLDGQGDTSWQPREDALVDPALGQVADDHINLAWAPDDGKLFAVTKTGLAPLDEPRIYVLRRDPDGTWTKGVFGLGSDEHTRPTIVVNPEADSVYVFARSEITGRGIVYRKASSTNNLSFPSGLGTPVIDSPSDGATNNSTSTKQIVTGNTGILVAASDQNTHYYLHHYMAVVDRAPIVVAPAIVSGSEASTVTIDVSAYDPDGQPITLLDANLSNLPAGNDAQFAVTPDNSSGVLTWTPGYEDAGSYLITFQAQNGRSGFATATVSVANVDRIPIVSGPTTGAVETGKTLVLNVSAWDPDSEPILSLTADLTGLPPGNTAVFTPGLNNATGTLTWTPRLADLGHFTVSFTAANAMSSMHQAQIYVVPRRPELPRNEDPPTELNPKLALSAASPNPAAAAVTFTLKLPAEGRVEWDIWDAQGRRVYEQGMNLGAGRHQLKWSGISTTGARAPAGIYFARVRVGSDVVTQRFIRL